MAAYGNRKKKATNEKNHMTRSRRSATDRKTTRAGGLPGRRRK